MRNSEINRIIKGLDASQADKVGLSNIGESIKGTASLTEIEKAELDNIVKNEQSNLQAKEAYMNSKIKEELDKLKK